MEQTDPDEPVVDPSVCALVDDDELIPVCRVHFCEVGTGKDVLLLEVGVEPALRATTLETQGVVFGLVEDRLLVLAPLSCE